MSDDFDGTTDSDTDGAATQDGSATHDGSSTMWTDEARGALRRAADELVAAIEAQTRALIGADAATGSEALDLDGEEVDRAAAAYSNAQFALSDEYFSLAEVTADDADDEGDDDLEDESDESEEFGDEDGDGEVASIVSVLQRADYAVTDVDAVLRAGREAYAATSAHAESDDADEAETERAELLGEPTDLGSALYEIAHASGWAALDALDGLEPLGGITEVIEPDEAIDLPTDLDEFDDDEDDDLDSPNELFTVDGRVLYTQFDVYGD